jgi:hypothetical protein
MWHRHIHWLFQQSFCAATGKQTTMTMRAH